MIQPDLVLISSQLFGGWACLFGARCSTAATGGCAWLGVVLDMWCREP